MAETVNGGAYLSPDGKTWHDANGQPIEGRQVEEAKRIGSERQEQLRQAEAQNMVIDPAMQRALQFMQAAQQPVARPAQVEQKAAK